MTSYNNACTWLKTWVTICCVLLAVAPAFAADEPQTITLNSHEIEIDLTHPWISTEHAGRDHSPAAIASTRHGHAHFFLQRTDAGNAHVWYSQWSELPIDIQQAYPIFSMTYRAKGYDAKSKHQAISVNDTDKPRERQHLRPMMAREIIPDDKPHTFTRDVRTIRKNFPRGSVHQLGVVLWTGDASQAELVISRMAFERDPAAADKPARITIQRDQAIPITVRSDLGHPLPDATITLNTLIKQLRQQTTTDAQGQAIITPWQTPSGNCRMLVTHPEHAPMFVTAKPGQPLVITLPKAVTLSGTVQDADGHGVPNAIVEFLENHDILQPDDVPGQHVPLPASVLTDENGNWSRDGVPMNRRQIDVVVWHPKFLRPYVSLIPGDPREAVTVNLLQEPSPAPITLRPPSGWVVTGTVTDWQGKPVEKATVHFGEHYRNRSPYPSTTTDQQGVYMAPRVNDEALLITVLKDGHAPAQAIARPQADDSATVLNLQLPKPSTTRVQIIDSQGKPQEGVWVNADGWGAFKGRLWSAKTDKQGQATWKSAPADPVDFILYRKFDQKIGPVSPSPDQQVFVMHAPGKITGTVTDAVTGKPVDAFIIRQIVTREELTRENVIEHEWTQDMPIEGRDGRYEIDISKPVDFRYFRVSAQGYLPWFSPVIKREDGALAFDVKLQPGRIIMGTLLSPQGKSIPDEVVVGYKKTNRTQVWGGHHGPAWSRQDAFSTLTDPSGRYQFSPSIKPEDIALLTVTNESGFIELRGDQIRNLETIQLQPYVEVSGTVMVQGKPEPHGKVKAYQILNPLSDKPETGPQHKDIVWRLTTQADAQGRYTLLLPPGGYQIGRHVVTASGIIVIENPQYLTFKAGRKYEGIDFGAQGQSVVGKLQWDQPAMKARGKNSQAYLRFIEQLDQELQVVPLDDMRDQEMQMRALAEQHGYEQFSIVNVPEADVHGNLTINQLSPGIYELEIVFYEAHVGSKIVGVAGKRFTVPLPKDTKPGQPVDIGIIHVEKPLREALQE